MDEQAQATTYTPRPGSVAERAIAHLKTHPPGTIVETAQLASSIDAPCNGMNSNLGLAVRAGVLKLHKIKGGANGARTNAYSLPKIDPFDADEARGGKPVQRIVDAEATAAPRAGVSSVFALADQMGPGALPFDLAGDDTPAPPPEPTGLNWKPGKPLPAAGEGVHITVTSQVASGVNRSEVLAAVRDANVQTAERITAPQHKAPPLDCALWSNGELWLRIDGAEPIVLRKAQTETLIHYLDRLAIELSPTTTT